MRLAHMVYFKLKDNAPAAVQKLLTACHTYLADHPGTEFFAAGTLAADLDREVNQRDWDVALQLVFASREAHDVYQEHPRHQQFIAENRESWERVQVFDANLTS